MERSDASQRPTGMSNAIDESNESDEDEVGPTLPQSASGAFYGGSRLGPAIPNTQDLALQRGKS